MEIAQTRQSCRSYEETKAVEPEKLNAVLEAARLAPSACNGQPYHITLCRGETAKAVAAAVSGMGMNKFAAQAPGSRLKGIDYRSIDIGILAAYLTAEAAAQGLGSCILGWLDSDKIRSICGLSGPVRLVITLGYAKEGDPQREKKRKPLTELVSEA